MLTDLANLAGTGRTKLAVLHQGHRPTPEAYDQHLKGQVWLRRVGYTEAKRAVSFFDLAIAADPVYADAYAAAAKASLMERAYRVDDAIEAHARAVEYIDKALALDPGLRVRAGFCLVHRTTGWGSSTPTRHW